MSPRVIGSCLDHIPIAFENHGDDADMKQLAAVGVAKKKMHSERSNQNLDAFLLGNAHVLRFSSI